MHSFYVPDIAAGVLPEEESLHAAKVLRLKEGDLVVLLDGKGEFTKQRLLSLILKNVVS